MKERRVNKSIIYITAMIILIVLTLSSIGLATWALLRTKLDIGGNVSFNGTGNVQATISNGKINYKETNTMKGFTIDEDYDEESNTNLSTWKNLNVEFDEDGNDVPLTFTITNNHPDKTLFVEMTSNYESNDNITMEVLALGQPYEDRVLISPNKSVEYMLLFSLDDTERLGTLDNFSVSLNMRNAKESELPVPTLDKLKFNVLDDDTCEVLASDTCEGDVVIPERAVCSDGNTRIVTGIAQCAFMGKNISSILIPKCITDISASAFEECSNLLSLTIPENVLRLGPNATDLCLNLKSLVFNNGIKAIEEGLYQCPNLRYINIPESINNLSVHTFEDCENLTQIVVDENNPNFSSEKNAIFNKDKTELFHYVDNKNKTSYSIPTSVTSIGYRAFIYCTSLTNVTIPSSVETIGEYAFSGCEGLTNIIIPSSVESIGDSAFGDCTNLTNITLQQTSGTVEISDAFSGIPDTATVNFSGAVWTCGSEVYSDDNPPASLSALASNSWNTTKVWTITK